jgi:hypothetical protein
MSEEFAALTIAVGAGLPEVRACLLLSRDGLALAAYPASEEARALAVWTKVAGLGEVERGFAAVGAEIWTFTRRGPYAGLALADPTARPGVVLDRLEQMLLVAEEARARKDAIREVPRPAPADAKLDKSDKADKPDKDVATEKPRRFHGLLHKEKDRGLDTEMNPQEPREEVTPKESAEEMLTPARDRLKARANSDEDQVMTDESAQIDPVSVAREFSGILSDPKKPGA